MPVNHTISKPVPIILLHIQRYINCASIIFCK